MDPAAPNLDTAFLTGVRTWSCNAVLVAHVLSNVGETIHLQHGICARAHLL